VCVVQEEPQDPVDQTSTCTNGEGLRSKSKAKNLMATDGDPRIVNTATMGTLESW